MYLFCQQMKKAKHEKIQLTPDKWHRCWWVNKMGLSPPGVYDFFQQMKNTKHRKYIWHQKGGIAVSESKRWGCRLLPHALVLSTNEKKQSIGNTADTRKVASLLVSQWVNKMGLSFPTPCSYFQQMKKTKHRKYSRHQKSGIAAGESMSQQDGAVVSYPM